MSLLNWEAVGSRIWELCEAENISVLFPVIGAAILFRFSLLLLLNRTTETKNRELKGQGSEFKQLLQ